jgi:hypothetical protein
MSKSANNIINIFLEDNLQTSDGIETDSTPLKIQNPETCNAFAIYNY